MKTLIILISFIVTTIPAYCQTHINIALNGPDLKNGDTAHVRFYRYNLLDSGHELFEERECKVNNNSIKATFINVLQVSTVDIQYKSAAGTTKYISNYWVSPGDDIAISLPGTGFTVTGKKSAFFSVQNELRRIEGSQSISNKAANLKRTMSQFDSIEKVQLEYLKLHAHSISTYEAELLNREISELPRYYMFDLFVYLLRPSFKEQEAKVIYSEYVKNLLPFDDKQFVSMLGLRYIFNRYKIDSCYLTGNTFSIKDYLGYLKSNFHGEVRDRLVIDGLKSAHYAGNINDELTYIANQSKNPTLKNIIEQYRNNSIDGAQAYDFSLRSTDNKVVKLSDFKGTPVVIDFWFTGCGACRITAPIVKRVKEQVAKSKIIFLSISIDKNLATWRKSVESGVYTSPNIINLNAGDKNGEIAIDKYKVAGYPTILIIDKQGRINHIAVNPQIDNGRALLSQIKSNL